MEYSGVSRFALAGNFGIPVQYLNEVDFYVRNYRWLSTWIVFAGEGTQANELPCFEYCMSDGSLTSTNQNEHASARVG